MSSFWNFGRNSRFEISNSALPEIHHCCQKATEPDGNIINLFEPDLRTSVVDVSWPHLLESCSKEDDFSSKFLSNQRNARLMVVRHFCVTLLPQFQPRTLSIFHLTNLTFIEGSDFSASRGKTNLNVDVVSFLSVSTTNPWRAEPSCFRFENFEKWCCRNNSGRAVASCQTTRVRFSLSLL